MNDEGLSLLKALQEVRKDGGKRHYSKALRARAAAWYRERRAQGVLCRDIGAELGIHPLQLARWARQEAAPRFRQFELVIPEDNEDPQPEHRRRDAVHSALPSAPTVNSGGSSDVPCCDAGLTLVSPGGWRVEGLGRDDLNRLVRLLS